MVLFVLVLKIVHFFVQMKTLDVRSNGTVCVITEESSYSRERNLKV